MLDYSTALSAGSTRRRRVRAEELRQFLARAPRKEHRQWEGPARRLARRVLRRLEASAAAAGQA